MREDAIWPNNQTRHGQLPHQESANCHISNRPTATLKIGQLPHLLLKKWLNLKFNLYLCTKIVKNMEYKKRIADKLDERENSLVDLREYLKTK